MQQYVTRLKNRLFVCCCARETINLDFSSTTRKLKGVENKHGDQRAFRNPLPLDVVVSILGAMVIVSCNTVQERAWSKHEMMVARGGCVEPLPPRKLVTLDQSGLFFFSSSLDQKF
jgi:hypothetical protein